MFSGAAGAGSKSADPLKSEKWWSDLAENILGNCGFTLTHSRVTAFVADGYRRIVQL